MRAVLYEPEHGLGLGDVPEPAPAPSQVVIEVAAASINFADVAFLSERQVLVPGFDASGVVIAPARDGLGPPVGSRVVTFGWSGAWAERRAVDVTELAAVPDGVDLGAAAAVPVAGVTALRALRRLGSVIGRRVLITGASGGVGRFAVQLAARAGAHVIASVGRPERGEGLAGLGASEVLVGLEDVSEPVHGALDNVGGRMLADLYALLEPGGGVQSIGMASREPTVIDFEEARLRGGGTRIEAFAVGPRFGADLAFLVGLVAAGEIDPQIGWRGPWEKVADAAAALLSREINGKAVLEVSPW